MDMIRLKILNLVIVTGTQKEAAKLLEITPSHLSDILRGRREVSSAVARRLGYRKVISYLPLPSLDDADHTLVLTAEDDAG